MNLFSYNILAYMLLPLALIRLLSRGVRVPAYRRGLSQRLGYYRSAKGHKKIWVHAVSVGEVCAAKLLIEDLAEIYPQYDLLITTTTPGGAEVVSRYFGSKVEHSYLPYDLPHIVDRFISGVNPAICVLVETELWPNLIHRCAKRSIPAVLVNGRLSERSARGYARFPQLTSGMLSKLSLAIVQSRATALRFSSLGMEPKKVYVGGNLKYDFVVDDELRHRAAYYKSQWQASGCRDVWIAASTHPGEEGIIVRVQKELLRVFPNILLVLVPRHPDRAAKIKVLCKGQGLDVIQLSSHEPVSDKTQVLLCDCTGELVALYGASDVAFVGGSLVSKGGHNPIEPAAWNLPILSGKHTENFREVFSLLNKGGGVSYVDDVRQLYQQLYQLIKNPAMRADWGGRNVAAITGNNGSVKRQLTLIESLL